MCIGHMAAAVIALRRPRRLVFASVLAVHVAAQPVLNSDYEAVLRRYARGDQRGAVAEIAEWRAADLDRQIRALMRAAAERAPCLGCPHPLDGLPLKAAVMLHFDRDTADRRPVSPGMEQPRPCPGAHASRAGQIASILAGREGTREFARRFFLAVAQHCQWDACFENALHWARTGLAAFPADPALALTIGATLEEGAALGTMRPEERRRWLREAERALEEAVQADPAAVEPRIRLGRVQWRRGKNDAAALTIQEALRRGGAPAMRYLAHLYLGQVHQRLGRWADAIREFRNALALHPDSQAAAVALSFALASTGDADGARVTLRQAVDRAGERTRRDPHWSYPAGNASSAAALLDELRRESRE